MLQSFVIILFLNLIGCQSSDHSTSKADKTPDLSWMVGNWIQIVDSSTIYYESWVKENDSIMSGKSAMINQGDTLFSEKINLKHLNKPNPVYSTQVYDGNHMHEVDFVLLSCVGGKAIFENKNNSFPQQVIYYKTTGDSLIATIEGNENGKFKREFFSMGVKK